MAYGEGMTDHEMLRALQGGDVLREEAASFAGRHLTKTAAPAVGGIAQRTLQFIKSHPAEIAGALVGSAAAGALQYAASRPGPSGKSREQLAIQEASAAQDRAMRRLKAEGKKPSFGQELAGATTKGLKPIADLLARHPGKAALALAPTGAGAGVLIARTLFK